MNRQRRPPMKKAATAASLLSQFLQQAGLAGRLPDLIRLEDMRADLQLHTRWSDGKQPVLDMARAAMQRGYQYVRSSPLMKWIALSTVFFSLLFFSLALPFSREATEQYVSEDSLATFLGLFNGFSTGAAFLSSLLLANRLFARVGIMACLLALPIIYLAGFASRSDRLQQRGSWQTRSGRLSDPVRPPFKKIAAKKPMNAFPGGTPSGMAHLGLL